MYEAMDAPQHPAMNEGAVKKRAPRSRKRLVVVGLVIAIAIAVGVTVGYQATSSSSSKTTTPSDSSTTPPNTTNTSTTTEPPKNLPPRPRYIFLGDSITEQGGFNGGFTDILKKTYINYIDVVNLAESGVNTNVTLVKTIPSKASVIQAKPTPTVIAVWLGNNDASLLGGQYEEKHVPIPDYKVNLGKMLDKLRELAPVAKLVLLTALVNDDDMRRARLASSGDITDPVDRTNQQAGLYAEACREVGAAKASMDVHVLDMYKYFMETYPKKEDRAKMLSDGMHLSLEGHRVTADQLAKFFLTLIPNAYPLETPSPAPSL